LHDRFQSLLHHDDCGGNGRHSDHGGLVVSDIKSIGIVLEQLAFLSDHLGISASRGTAFAGDGKFSGSQDFLEPAFSLAFNAHL
jgi:hypothetical protein